MLRFVSLLYRKGGSPWKIRKFPTLKPDLKLLPEGRAIVGKM